MALDSSISNNQIRCITTFNNCNSNNEDQETPTPLQREQSNPSMKKHNRNRNIKKRRLFQQDECNSPLKVGLKKHEVLSEPLSAMKIRA